MLFVCISVLVFFLVLFCFFKQKTAYEMRISDWSSDVCSSDLRDFGTLDPGFGYVLERVKRPEGKEYALTLELLIRIIIIEGGTLHAQATIEQSGQIGRASWRERVCQYV